VIRIAGRVIYREGENRNGEMRIDETGAVWRRKRVGRGETASFPG
jgi:hypothetical protein